MCVCVCARARVTNTEAALGLGVLSLTLWCDNIICCSISATTPSGLSGLSRMRDEGGGTLGSLRDGGDTTLGLAALILWDNLSHFWDNVVAVSRASHKAIRGGGGAGTSWEENGGVKAGGGGAGGEWNMPKSFLARFHRLLWDLRGGWGGVGGGEVIGPMWETMELSWLAPCRKWWKMHVQGEAVVEGTAVGGEAVEGMANDLALPKAVSTAVSQSTAEVLPVVANL